MEYTILGRTGLRVSVAGLGCGGYSRLGLATGHDQDHAERVVATALDLGINFIDTARAYGTEQAVGSALRGRRDQVVLSTKASPGWGADLVTAANLRDSLEKSLARLQTDYVDVFHLHGVLPGQYDYCVSELLPELLRQRDAGKIRFLGITERFADDTRHELLSRALADDVFDVMMVGFNFLNPSARRNVFAATKARNVGTLIMFAVRRALTNMAALGDTLGELVANGALDAAKAAAQPLEFLSHHPALGSLVETAYRFCRHEPGADVVLTGTGNTDHLRDNIAAILAQPLPADVLESLDALFGRIDSISGD